MSRVRFRPLRRPDFLRLYATRLASQTADGVFTASLAGAVVFSPQRGADAAAVAGGFVVLLLPYSVVGPFAGVLLDRWRRQRVLVVAAVLRAALVGLTAALLLARGGADPAFYAAALAVVSVNRFTLAALSAALPHVVTTAELVPANSLSTTSGTVVALLGGGLGVALRAAYGGTDAASAGVALAAGAGYLIAAGLAARIGADLLGPQHPDAGRLGAALLRVVRGMLAGARHVAERRRAGLALLAIGGHRFAYGVSTISVVLLYRNYFTDQGVLQAGLPGLAQVFAAGLLGVLTAAVVTPRATARVGTSAWVVTVFLAAAGTELALGLPFTQASVLAAAYLLGVVAQASKICVDTIVQREVDDAFRGRVFALYDTLFNVAFVAAAITGAFVLPPDGKSAAVVVGVALGYAAVAAGYGAGVRRVAAPSRSPSSPPPEVEGGLATGGGGGSRLPTVSSTVPSRPGLGLGDGDGVG